MPHCPLWLISIDPPGSCEGYSRGCIPQGRHRKRSAQIAQFSTATPMRLGGDGMCSPFVTSATTMFEWQKHSQKSSGVPDYRDLLEFLNLCAQASVPDTNQRKSKLDFSNSSKALSKNGAIVSFATIPKISHLHQSQFVSCVDLRGIRYMHVQSSEECNTTQWCPLWSHMACAWIVLGTITSRRIVN